MSLFGDKYLLYLVKELRMFFILMFENILAARLQDALAEKNVNARLCSCTLKAWHYLGGL